MPTSVIPGETDLATTHPDLAALWHPGNTKSPEQVSSGSDYRAKWLCAACGQTSEATVFRRAREGLGCPVCAGRVIVPGINDLATMRPEIAAQFVRDPLGKHDPTTVPVGSNLRFEWRCDVCTYVWEQRVNHRTAGRGCPACSGKVVAPGINDLATKFPDIAAELDDENYTADQLLPNSNIMVQWTCANGHTWETRVFNRTRGNNGCNTCVRKEFSSVFERDILALVTAAIPDEDITPTARSVVKNRELDMYVPDRHIAIEANGVYWHTEKFGKTERYHADKAEACAVQGINLITIWEDDWKTRRPAAEAYLLAQFQGRDPGTLHLDGITLAEANEFIAAHSLDAPVAQNTSKAFPLVAASAHENGELVAVIVYRKTTERALRIERYAAVGASPRYLESFISYLEGTVTGYDHILYDDNAERSQRATFAANGFAVRNKLNPRYTLVKGSTRYTPDAPEVNDGGEYDVSDDTRYEKAWDCGGAVLRRERKNPVVMSVTVQNPELLGEWRSADISPDETLIGSGKVVQWECENGHTWECKVFERTKRGRTCPECRRADK